MRRILVIILVWPLLLNACSAAISHQRDKKRQEILQKVAVGAPRSEVIKTLGQPKGKDGEHVDFHTVCLPRKGVAGLHVAMDVLTVGFWELVGTPLEASRDCDVKGDIAVVYDDKNVAIAILSRDEYQTTKEVYQALLRTARMFKEDSTLTLLSFDVKDGWFFADKENIRCHFQNKYIKIYVKSVPTLIEALEYQSKFGTKDTVAYIHTTVLIDLANDQFRLTSSNLHDKDGRILNKAPDTEWSEMYPGSYIRTIADSMAYYCANQRFREFEKKKDPEFRDFFKEKRLWEKQNI
jgi:hypothetical protein